MNKNWIQKKVRNIYESVVLKWSSSVVEYTCPSLLRNSKAWSTSPLDIFEDRFWKTSSRLIPVKVKNVTLKMLAFKRVKMKWQCGCENTSCPFCNIVLSIRNRDPAMDAEGLWGARLEGVLKRTFRNISKLSKIYNLNVIKIYSIPPYVLFLEWERSKILLGLIKWRSI